MGVKMEKKRFGPNTLGIYRKESEGQNQRAAVLTKKKRKKKKIPIDVIIKVTCSLTIVE
jgi:hypothetical protein